MLEGKKILMTLMGLDIGGAETHVVELSKELNKRGINIIVASNGGVYEDELKKAHIKHIKVPLHNKKPLSVFKSYRKLKEIIKNENIDIVHAHARIPAFICGILHKKMKFPFITTAHWVFNTKWGLKYLTNWGERTIAVSDDVKKYLIQNYGINENNIKVTINGIDMDKFSPNIDYSDIYEELKLSKDTKKVVCVSRLDDDRSIAAFELINAADMLLGKMDNIEYIIVGGGTQFERIHKNADVINKKAGKKIIHLTGPRTDINKFATLADVAVGVSRAALEMMSSQRPVIVAGNEGYMGIYGKSKLKDGIQTNFTCRGLGKTTANKLSKDICNVLNMSPEELKELSEYCRQTVKDFYSVKKMADDNMEVYSLIVKR